MPDCPRCPHPEGVHVNRAGWRVCMGAGGAGPEDRPICRCARPIALARRDDRIPVTSPEGTAGDRRED